MYTYNIHTIPYTHTYTKHIPRPYTQIHTILTHVPYTTHIHHSTHTTTHTVTHTQLSRAKFRAWSLFSCEGSHTLESPGLIICCCHSEIVSHFWTPNFHFALSPQLSLTAKRVWRTADSLTLRLFPVDLGIPRGAMCPLSWTQHGVMGGAGEAAGAKGAAP